MPKISVIGSLNMDLIVQLERMPLSGETIAGMGLKLVPGGKGANQAVAVSKAGAEATMYGCIGDDSFGEELLGSLEHAGVNVSEIIVSNVESTGIAAILLESSGENRIIVIPGSNKLVDNDFVNSLWNKITESDLIVLQHEIPLSTCHYIINLANEASIPVLLNPAPFYPIPAEILKKVEYLVTNETELQGLLDYKASSAEDLIIASYPLLETGLKNLIITLGKEGSVLLNKDMEIRQPAFYVDPVDTTAAGDTFVGFFAATMLTDHDPRKALEIASAAAAIAVTKLGAQTSIPSIDEVQALIFKNKNIEGVS